MSKKMRFGLRRFLYVGFVSAFVLSLATAALARHDEEDSTGDHFKIGKNGEVNIKIDIRIGDTILKKGKYVVQHQVEGTGHRSGQGANRGPGIEELTPRISMKGKPALDKCT